MSGKQAVEEAIARLPENELIPASAFYHAHLAEQVTEAAYYKALERLCELSEHSQILGSLMPDSDRVFALLRFVQEGSRVVILTAVAEE